MGPIVLDDPSTNAAENVARIKAAIEQANKHYAATGEKVTVQLGAGTWVVTGDKTNPSAGAIELLSGVELTGSGDRDTVIKLEDNFNARLNGIVRTALETVENVTISNLVIDGNRDNNIGHQAGFICGVKEGSGKTQSNIVLDNVEARNCTAYGINPHEITYDLTVRNSASHNNGLDGFVADGVVRGTYENNVAYNNDRHGFNIQNASTEIILKDNTAYDNGTGATGGAGIVVQRGDVQRGNEAEIAHVTHVQIIGGEYYGNTREGILVKLSDNVTITGANIHDNARQGVRIEGSVNTILRDSVVSSNSQEAQGSYDEVRILDRKDYPDGNPDNNPSTNPLKTYYSTGTQILDNVINPENARYAIREEPSNSAGGPTGTVISGNVTSGATTDGPDTLTGSAGVDTMAGGKGDDTYFVNKDGDVVIENRNEGTDHVFASAKHTLGANVENLTLTGTAAINGYGNDLNNVITGNDAANNLEGVDGADTIFGAGGSDTLKGGAGNDYLDGGMGADSMVGGVGDDTYVVDHVGDLTVEKADGGLGGYDRVFSSISFTLSDEVEELTLTGSANLSATGNSGANTLIGNAGNNTLDGAGGADTMRGGSGDDTYYVNHTGDFVVEEAGQGIDTIISSISISAANPLANNVENLWLIDPINPSDPAARWAIEGAGNQLNNVIVGNGADNKLFGLGGNDTLIGGLGNDTLDGGADTDTVVYAGKRADYTIVDTATERKVTGPDTGTDTLRSIEILQFADGRLVGDVWQPNAAVLSSATENLTETNAFLSTGGQLTISDVESEATFRAQSNVAGQYGMFSIGADGKWTYVTSSAHDALKEGEKVSDVFDVFSADGTKTTVTVTITGTNDAAQMSADVVALTEGDTAAAISTAGQLTIKDVDSEATFRAQTGTAGRYGTFSIGPDGKWTYVASSAHNEFVKDQIYTDSFEVFSADGTKTTVTVNITGTEEVVPPANPQIPGTPGSPGIEIAIRAGTSRSEKLNGEDGVNDIIKGQGGHDTIKGYGANDTLSGGTGNDRLFGDDGDDLVKGDSGHDKVYGSAGNDRLYGGSGNDTVDGGSGNDWVYGDSGNDRTYGGLGDDVVNGGAGNDRLYGGAGSDAFVFNTKLGSAGSDRKLNFDTITDFNVNADSLWLDDAIFRKLGSGTSSNPGELNKEFFVTGTKAKERDDYLIYNNKTGVLSYDADGSGSKESVEFAQLSKNLKLTYKDFFII